MTPITPESEHIAALQDDLQLARHTIERQEAEIQMLMDAARAATKQNVELRKQLQSWADEADADIQLAKLMREEREACGL